MLFVLDAYWFMRPKKDPKSIRLLGTGNLRMASVTSLLMEYPADVKVNPANDTLVWQNWNFSRFKEIPLSWQCCNGCSMWRTSFCWLLQGHCQQSFTSFAYLQMLHPYDDYSVC